jgi:hypothetical protein
MMDEYWKYSTQFYDYIGKKNILVFVKLWSDFRLSGFW